MSAIDSNSLFNRVTSEFNLRRIEQVEPSKFNQTILQIADQQSRDKEFERGLEWLRTYIASLQAKLNSSIEELNTIYQKMLTEMMNKKADAKNTAGLLNGVENAAFDICYDNGDITPYTKYVRNYQYNPFFGSRGLDLINYADQNDPKLSALARAYYQNEDGSYKEFGAATYGTLNYLWMWDIDRINASYATTMDRFISIDDNVSHSVNSAVKIHNYARLHVDPEAEILWNGTTYLAGLDLDKDGFYDIISDAELSIVQAGRAATDPHPAEQFQVNVTALQPNRGVFFPTAEEDPDLIYNVIYETWENDGVLQDTDGGLDDCKWTQTWTNPYDRDIGAETDYLKWRIAENRAYGGSQSVHFGDPTNSNYLWEYYIIKDDVEVPAVGPVTGQSNPPQIFGVAGSAGQTNRWSETHTTDPRSGADTVKWRTHTNISRSGTHSYYFGNTAGTEYYSGLTPTPTTYDIQLDWNSDGDNFNLVVTGPGGQMVKTEHRNDCWDCWGSGDSGAKSTNDNPDENYIIGPGNNPVPGYYNVKIVYADAAGAWGSDTAFSLKIIQDGGNTADGHGGPVWNYSGSTGSCWIFGIIDPPVWFGAGSMVTNPIQVPSGTVGYGDSSGEVPGVHLYYDNYVPHGDMVRDLDLTNMMGPDGTGMGFEALELRYYENYATETWVPGSYDFKRLYESTNNGGSYTLIEEHADSDSGGWAFNLHTLSNTNFGTTNERIRFNFDAVDSKQNDRRGWNIDDIEVVARGESVGQLISPQLDLTQYVTATLEWYELVDVDDIGNDSMEVYYSLDGGITWEPTALYTSTTDTVGWEKQTVDLACAAGQENVKVKFVFHNDANQNANNGWNIDNVRVFGRKSANTDFYMYREDIDDRFVTGSTNSAENTATIGMPNISFDPRRTNVDGKYTTSADRVQITNTIYPMFSNTLLTYVEQDPNYINARKETGNSTVWFGDNVTEVLAVDKTGKIKVVKNEGFTKNSFGQWFNNNGDMFIDDALAINLGLITNKIPTAEQIGSKSTGWVNYDPVNDWLPYVANTCFDESNGTYEYMSIFAKKTVFSDGPQTINVTLTADDDAYLIVNGSYVSSRLSNNGTQTFSIDLVDGINTIGLIASEDQGADHVRMTSTFSQLNGMDETWAVSIISDGYIGESGAPAADLSNSTFRNQKITEMLKQDKDNKKGTTLFFSNKDEKGEGILSDIRSLKVVVTGEPTVQSYSTSVFDSTTTTETGNLITRLSKGYMNNSRVTGSSTSAWNLGPTSDLNYMTDKDGQATVDLYMTNDPSLTNDATVMVKVDYYEDSNRDGKISGTETSNLKTKYIGLQDLRDTTYYGTPGNVVSQIEDRFQMSGNKVLSDINTTQADNIYNNRNVFTTTLTSSPAIGATSFVVSSASAANITSGDILNIGNQTVRVSGVSGNTITFSSTPLTARLTSGTVVTNTSATMRYQNDYSVGSTGRSGGSTASGTSNALTQRLRELIDSPEWQEVLKYRLLDSVYIAATVSDNRGDQIVGKLILDWDWRRRRIDVQQASFSAIYKA